MIFFSEFLTYSYSFMRDVIKRTIQVLWRNLGTRNPELPESEYIESVNLK